MDKNAFPPGIRFYAAVKRAAFYLFMALISGATLGIAIWAIFKG